MNKYMEQDINWAQIDVDDLLFEVQELVRSAKQLAPLYADATDCEYNYTSPDDEVSFEQNGITVRETSNEACSCHPEYHTYELTIPPEVLQRYVRGEDWKTDVMKETLARREQKRVAVEQAAKQQERAAAERKRARDLDTLAKLKKEYPDE